MKKLKLEYRKIKDRNGKTGQGHCIWKFYKALNNILGNHPSTRLPTVIDTSANNSQIHSAEENQEELTSNEEQDDVKEENVLDSPPPSSSDTPTPTQPSSPAQNSSERSEIRAKRKRKTRDKKITAAITSIVMEVIGAQQKSDQLFIELEEKQMKYEAEQKQQERQFQLWMMSMIYSNHSSRSPSSGYGNHSE